MLVRRALVPPLVVALCASLVSAAPLVLGGHHGPPKPPGPTSGGDTTPHPPPTAPTGPTTPPKPPPGGGAGNGGAAPKAPSAPGGREGGGGAHTGAPAGHGPSTGGSGGGQSTPGSPGVGARPPAASGPMTGADAAVLDPSWNVWWFFHEDEFLRYAEGPSTAERSNALALDSSDPAADPVLAAISGVIERERSTEILTGALLGAARLPGTPARDAIRRGLGSTTSRVRELSVLALGAADDERALGELETLLRNEAGQNGAGAAQGATQRVRAHAAYALGLLGERTESGRTRQLAARALSDVLTRDRSASADLQVACALALGLVPLPASPLESRDPEDATPWVSRERMARCLLAMLSDKERPDALRAQLPCVLARLAEGAAASARAEVALAVAETLRRGSAVSSGVREGCLFALGELGRPTRGETDLAVQAALLQSAERGPEAERCLAWMALSTLAARDGDGETDAAQRDVLRKRMLRGLSEVRSRERAWIALSLGVLENRRARAGDRVPSQDVRAALRAAFAHASGPEEESGIAMGIGLSGDLQGAQLVGERLGHVSQSDVAGYELLAIGLAHDASQREKLRGLLATSTDPLIVEHAAEALALIGDPELTRTLLAGVQTNASLEARESHVLALTDIGDRTALALLCRKLGDESQPPCMRAALSLALGGIRDHGARKWYTGLRTLANWRVPSLTLYTGDGQGVLEIG